MSEQSLNAKMQAAVEAYAANRVEPRFARLHLRSLIPLVERTARVDPRPLLIGRTAYERVWVVINRGVRGIIRHAAEPVVEQQNAWNTQLTHTLERLAAADAALHGEAVRMRAEAHRRDR
jgi:hypothetical protein